MKSCGARRPFWAGCLAVWVLGSAQVQALVLYPSGDPAFNTTPPTGTLADSGWQYAGWFNSFTGYPISPDSFLVSKHVVGSYHARISSPGILLWLDTVAVPEASTGSAAVVVALAGIGGWVLRRARPGVAPRGN